MADQDDTFPLGGPDALPAGEERPHRPRGSAAPLLVAIGVLLLGCGLVPAFQGFVDRHFGLERVVAAALGLLFLYVAWVAREQARLRERFLDLLEEVLKVFYGPNFRRERQAIDILVRAMESESANVRQTSREHLVRLTGTDLGEDGDKWTAWWAENRAGFRSPRSGGQA